MPYDWTSTRQSVLVSIFLTNLMNFTLQWLARKSKDQSISYRIRSLRFKVFMFGLLGLFGCNLVHSGILVAVVSWIILINFSILHFMYFKQFDNKKRALVNLVLHGLLFAYVVINIASFASQTKT